MSHQLAGMQEGQAPVSPERSRKSGDLIKNWIPMAAGERRVKCKGLTSRNAFREVSGAGSAVRPSTALIK